MKISKIGFLAAAALTALSGTAVAQTGPYQYYALTPCRLYDSRTGNPSALGTGGGPVTTTLSDSTGLVPLRARGACGV
ncbi:MAG TPA: hypothetical protein VMV60_02280, partial [Thermoanaerobaculia bacterium]|nr:hypothetical protein [Thermoanaerobaculia bacterium]